MGKEGQPDLFNLPPSTPNENDHLTPDGKIRHRKKTDVSSSVGEGSVNKKPKKIKQLPPITRSNPDGDFWWKKY